MKPPPGFLEYCQLTQNCYDGVYPRINPGDPWTPWNNHRTFSVIPQIFTYILETHLELQTSLSDLWDSGTSSLSPITSSMTTGSSSMTRNVWMTPVLKNTCNFLEDLLSDPCNQIIDPLISGTSLRNQNLLWDFQNLLRDFWNHLGDSFPWNPLSDS